MNEWSRRRKRVILLLLVFFLVVFVGAPAYFLFYRAPTCFDGRQNGNEAGVDCGGSCQLLCTTESLPLILRGDPRVLSIAPGVFEVVAVVENPNASADIYRARYILRLYDASRALPVKIIEGETYVPKGTTFAIFEGPFTLEDGAVPIRATLEWHGESLEWRRNANPIPELAVKGFSLSREITNPRLDAVVENMSLEEVFNIDLVSLIYEDSGNIIAASKTFIDRIAPGASAPAVFTWPRPFEVNENICGNIADVALALDRSGSMSFLSNNPPQPLTDVKSTAVSFINQLSENDRYALVSFANDASDPIDAPLGVSSSDMRQAINNIAIRTGDVQNTNIGAGILSARQELNSPRHRDGVDKVLVLLTDGVPTLPTRQGETGYPTTFALESAELAKQDGINIYTIGLGRDVDIDLLRNIATTPADAYLVPTTRELADIYSQISTKICRRGIVDIDIYLRVLPDRSFIR